MIEKSTGKMILMWIIKLLPVLKKKKDFEAYCCMHSCTFIYFL